MSEQNKPHILVINGPNLNLLGEREPDVYGTMTLEDLCKNITSYCQNLGVTVQFFQSNHEGFLIDFLHDYRKIANGIVINPGALTHYSYALHDALIATSLPAVEVHLSDIESREEFRKISVTKAACIDQISGLGAESYFRGIDSLLKHLNS